ncbi:SPOR domain-containing protein [Lysobacter humi (ex Lee et al. 2017)]
MEPALKQRLLGAAVLVALAVTFLPLLVMDPAPESGASTVPLRVPAAPKADGTIVMPIGPDATAPAAAVAESPSEDAPAAANGGMMPAATAGGDYAVTFGRYATAADAAKVVAALRASQLPAYHEPSPSGTRTLHRVLVGPFASHAVAEGARLRAAHVNDQVDSRVITLDAGATTASSAAPPKPSAAPPPATTTVAARPSSAVATQPLAPPKPATPAPAATPSAAAPAPAAPAASGVGFAVQLGAFANADEAARLRDRARAAGFPAFVERVQTGSGTLNRVRIGPVTDRAEADRLRARAAGALGVDGLVRPHP